MNRINEIETEMREILVDLRDANDQDINEENLQELYRDAINALNIWDGDNEDGENDLFEFNQRKINRYYELKGELKMLEFRKIKIFQKK